ncbi:MAG: hypothetical protein GPI90_21510 [Microcystis aeruginosa K13-05]|jgi:uncharacterized protein with von Willebrand factor type A (vWA) domain|uniref:hypothetical protein n=1 Tax=Microcystis sp. LE19-41.2A TaxID=3016427 RepID=UPI0022C3D73D|nr:hypothetical protein [Microcystis sp. LE19-41.2A]MCZ8048891.1 hypothetical protein [Microcystis sp. LE19-41.2A]NCR82348.1 hypothetical protein [Microcystis aeruginosa K13-10]NCR87039.1 hypothetical protein [Microcystis aeruginosa K13-05]
MAELDTSLFQVFQRLRRNGVPLGVSDYLEAIETIRGGMGLEDNDRFKELLRLFWAKSREDQELFDTAFAELVEPHLKIITTPIPRTPTSIAPPPTNPESTTTAPQPPSISPEPQPQLQPQEVQQPQPEKVILASAVKQSFVLKTDFTESPHSYQLTPRLPLNRRDMAGVWRQLRRPQRVGVPEELDVEGTIDSICRTGLLLRPVLQPRRRNLACLLVLMDQQGSMVPFVPLIEAAIESISRGGLLGKIDCYYFHDCPEQFFYQRPTLTNAWPLEEVLQEKAKGNSVLIISDGGAARGYYDGMRVGDTKTFLQTLSTYTYLYAWLNPMPQNRWLTTTAEDIANMVPMFPLEREGLEDAVNILRGHPFPAGVGLNE